MCRIYSVGEGGLYDFPEGATEPPTAMEGGPPMKKIATFGPWRVDVERHTNAPHWQLRSGGRKTPWPWRELIIPRAGSIILGRTRPRRHNGRRTR